MKRKRNVAFLVLIAATVAMLAAGFYLSVMHQEARPSDSAEPASGP